MALTASAVLTAASTAQALGTKALVLDGQYWGFNYSAFDAALVEGGASSVDLLTALPGDLSPYHLAVWVLPSKNATAGEVSALTVYLKQGGTLVLVSDYKGYAPEPWGVFNDFLGQTSFGSRFLGGASAYGCDASTHIVAHPLTAGLTSFESAAPSDVMIGPAGKSIIDDPSGSQRLVVVEKNLVLLSDSNPINTVICSVDKNKPFWVNLPKFACDVDGDGEKAKDCGGPDPDDLDAAVTSVSTGAGSGATSGAGGAGHGSGGGQGGGSGGNGSGGDGSTTSQGGCGCRVGNEAEATAAPAWALAVTWLGLRRWRRKKPCALP